MLRVWGSNREGQLGLRGRTAATAPAPLRHPFASAVVKSCGGLSHTLILTEHGDVYACGRTREGQLGVHPAEIQRVSFAGTGHGPSSQSPPSSRRSAAAERLASRNLRARCGAALKGLPTSCPQPLHISGLAEHKVVDACCGALHSMAVTAGGRLFWWGLLHEDPAPEADADPEPRLPADTGAATAPPPSGAAEDPDHAAARDHHVDAEVRRAHAAEMAQDAVPRSLVGVRDPRGEGGEAPGAALAAPTPHTRHDVAGRAEQSAVAYLAGSVASEAKVAGQRSMRLRRTPCILPRRVESLSQVHVVQVAAGYGHSVARSADGLLYSSGYNDRGQLGLGHRLNSAAFAPIRELAHRFRHVACGDAHNVALTEDGATFTWGSGALGQLGIGPRTSDRLRPVPVQRMQPPVGPVSRVAAGANHTVALTASGVIYSWGHAEYGQHGSIESMARYETRFHFTPRRLAVHPDARAAWEAAHIVDVACGAASTFARTSDGRLFSWGWNAHGVLGHGSLGAALPQPAEVDALPAGACIAVACGAVHAMSVTGVEGHPWALTLCHLLPNQPHRLDADAAKAVAVALAAAQPLTAEGGQLVEPGPSPPAPQASEEGAASDPVAAEGSRVGKCEGPAASGRAHPLRQGGRPARAGKPELDQTDGAACPRSRVRPSRAVHDLIAARAGALARLNEMESGPAVHAPRTRGTTATNGSVVRGDADPRPAATVELRVVRLPRALLPPALPPAGVLGATSGRSDSPQSVSIAFADIVFVVEGHAVWAHAWILEARCGVLFRAATRGVVDSAAIGHQTTGGGPSHDRITVVELRAPVRLDALLALLEYLYTDSFEFPPHRTHELLALADALRLRRLRAVLDHRIHGTPLIGSPLSSALSGEAVEGKETSDFLTDSERLSQASGSTFVHDMLAFLRHPDSACVDVLLVPGREPESGPPVPAVRALLCRYSFFAALLSGRFRPSDSGTNRPRVTVPEASRHVLGVLAEWACTGVAVGMGPTNILPVLVAAKMCDMGDMSTHCEAVVCANLESEDAADHLAFAEHYGASRLAQTCRDLIAGRPGTTGE